MFFKVYYANGDMYSGTPDGAPLLGVALIMQSDKNHGRTVVTGGDFYVWNPERECWISGDKYTKQYYAEAMGWEIALAGVMMHLEDYIKVWKQAEADQDIPARTAYYANEPRIPDIKGN